MDGQEVFEMADGMGHAVMQRGDPVRDEIGMLFFVRTLAPHPSPCPCLSRLVPARNGPSRLPPDSRAQPSQQLRVALWCCCGCAGGCGQRGSGGGHRR